jgi:hypothetical protein
MEARSFAEHIRNFAGLARHLLIEYIYQYLVFVVPQTIKDNRIEKSPFSENLISCLFDWLIN